jgi:hypothetical protein
MTKHIMVDLETLGLGADAAIIQIGAVTDDGKEFLATVDCKNWTKAGKVDGSTLGWWMQQSEQARDSLFLSTHATIVGALGSFKGWVDQEAQVWAHAAFDIPMLEYRAAASGLGPLFSYRKIRDLRTIESLLGSEKPKQEREGIYHNALDDAKYQMARLKQLLGE